LLSFLVEVSISIWDVTFLRRKEQNYQSELKFHNQSLFCALKLFESRWCMHRDTNHLIQS
jgi:hypothetical protein